MMSSHRRRLKQPSTPFRPHSFKVNCSMVPSHLSTMEAKANYFDSQTPVERVTGLSIRLETSSSIVSIKPTAATLSLTLLSAPHHKAPLHSNHGPLSMKLDVPCSVAITWLWLKSLNLAMPHQWTSIIVASNPSIVEQRPFRFLHCPSKPMRTMSLCLNLK